MQKWNCGLVFSATNPKGIRELNKAIQDKNLTINLAHILDFGMKE